MAVPWRQRAVGVAVLLVVRDCSCFSPPLGRIPLQHGVADARPRQNLVHHNRFLERTTTSSGSTSTALNLSPSDILSSSSTHLLALNLNLNLDDLIYSAQSSASSLTSTSMGSSTLSLSSLLIIYTAGLLTSFSPCSLGLLPLTISYISSATGERSDGQSFIPTLAFAAGLASVFVGLGLSAALLGGVFGSSGNSAAGGVVGGIAWGVVLSSLVSLLMGLQLLELVDLPLPSLELEVPSFGASQQQTTSSLESSLFVEGEDMLQYDADGKLLPPTTSTPSSTTTSSSSSSSMALVRTFLLGGSSALVASPCATPVLASILAYVANPPTTDTTTTANNSSPILGAALLLAYTLGYATPLLVVGATGGQALATLANAASNNGDEDGEEGWVQKVGGWVNPTLGAVLIGYGTNGMLTAVWGDPSMAGLAPVMM